MYAVRTCVCVCRTVLIKKELRGTWIAYLCSFYVVFIFAWRLSVCCLRNSLCLWFWCEQFSIKNSFAHCSSGSRSYLRCIKRFDSQRWKLYLRFPQNFYLPHIARYHRSQILKLDTVIAVVIRGFWNQRRRKCAQRAAQKNANFIYLSSVATQSHIPICVRTFQVQVQFNRWINFRLPFWDRFFFAFRPMPTPINIHCTR